MGREGTGLCGLQDFKFQCPGSSPRQKSRVEGEDPQVIISTCSELLLGVCVLGRGCADPQHPLQDLQGDGLAAGNLVSNSEDGRPHNSLPKLGHF